MTPEEYLDALLNLPALLGPRVSPDGKWVAWTWRGVGPAADVFAAPTDGSAEPLRLTDTPENTFVASWTSDSQAVLVTQDKGGDERDQLFRVDLMQPGLLHPLTDEAPNHFMRGGQLHPDGKWLIYGANRDPESGDEIEQTLVYRHDLQNGERVALARPTNSAYLVPRLNLQGTHILYGRSKDGHPAGRQVWLVGIDGEDDREIIAVGADKKAHATWFPDGRRALVVAETETHNRVGVWSLDSGEVRWLLDDVRHNIEDAFVPHGSERAVIVEVEDATLRPALMNVENGALTLLARVPGNLLPLAPVGAGEWAGLYYSSQQPADLVRFSLDDPRPETFVSLTRVWERTTLTSADLAAAQNFRWESLDSLGIQGWLYRPAGPAKGTVVYVHGGPTAHSRDAINPQIQFFVAQGYNVLDPNYRGSTGFSRAYREAIKVDGWGGREQDDIRSGIETLIARGIAEAGKVGITGTSYGGYSSWCGITRFPRDVLAAAAPICGMTDLVVDYNTTRPDLRPYSEEMLGGSPDDVAERYHERSPINFVGNIQGRLLIVQGTRDPNVTPENVRTVREALSDAGIEHQLLAFDDEGHGISRPKNQKALYQQLATFFAEAFAS